jgi:DNA polymerase elongation subunit (family B)
MFDEVSCMTNNDILSEIGILESMVLEDKNYIDGIIEGTFNNADLLKNNVVMTANGVYFSKEKQGFIPEIIEKIYTERRDVKQEMLRLEQELQTTTVDVKKKKEKVQQLNSQQYVLKIALNSLFGAIANRHFRYYDIRIASAITMTGQATVRRCEKNTNAYLNSILNTKKDYVIAIDTDSVFVNMGPIIDKYVKDQSDTDKVIAIMDKISKEKILPMMNKGFDDLFVYLNGYKSRMNIKRESLCSKALWVAKKKYVMYVYNNEGVQYAEPRLKIKGLEIVRSSTPEICREAIKNGVKIIFDHDEKTTQDYIKEFKEKFLNSSADVVAFPRGISDIEKWIDRNGNPKSGMPMQVTAAYNHNMLIDRLDLNSKYEKIKSGEKVKFVYLKKPNPVQSHTIAFPSLLPKEFGMEDYVDYETQFEKSFLSPIKSIMDSIGWETEKKNDLYSLFD